MTHIARNGSCTVLLVTGCLSACNAELPLTDEVSEGRSALTAASKNTIPCDARAYAITANTGTVVVSAASKVDSYQPSKGTYGGGNVGQYGSVRAATSIIVNGGGVISGTQVPNSPAHLAVVPVPSGATNLPLGSKAPGNVTINTSASSITLAPGSYVASNVTVNSAGAINIKPQGKVQIWVTGSLNLGGNENLNGLPSNLTFLVNSSNAVNVNSNGQLFGRIYAPSASVSLSSPVFGSVVGSSVTLNSGSAVHFAAPPRAISAVVNSTLYPQISPAFETYCQDLDNEGYQVMVRTMSSTSAASDLRNVLIADHTNYAIEGAFFIGNLPYALYEDSNPPFALDYYFMDLTGTWTDTNGNGVFDGHSDPDHGPEIYVGRLRADNMGLSETDLVNSYFQRNHAYRTAGSSLPQRAVEFSAYSWPSPQRLETVYGVAQLVDHAGPSGNDFLSLLGSNSGELYLVTSDSWATGHTFASPAPHPDPWSSDPTRGSVYSSDIAGFSKAYHFFLLHACSAEDFTVNNNLGSTYLLVNTQGLAAIGVTKGSGTGYFNNAFAPNFLAMDQTWGMALFQFDTLFANDDIAASDEGGFHILGDPTLRLNSGAGTLPAPTQPRTFVWNNFNNDYQYSGPDSLATYGGYYDLVYFSTLGTNSQWTDSTNRNFGDYNNDVEVTPAANDFALFTFDGSGVDYYAETAPGQGKMDVYVDFVLQQTVNLNTSTRQAQKLVYSFQWDRNGRHNILLVNRIQGQAGVVDFFRVRRDK